MRKNFQGSSNDFNKLVPAYQVVLKKDYDIIFMDCQMPVDLPLMSSGSFKPDLMK